MEYWGTRFNKCNLYRCQWQHSHMEWRKYSEWQHALYHHSGEDRYYYNDAFDSFVRNGNLPCSVR